MRFKYDNGPWYTYDEFTKLDKIDSGSPLVLIFDPGKTNMALVVGTIYGEVLRIYEFSGKDCDTTIYCDDVREFLIKLFGSDDISMIAHEMAITKAEGHHYSDVVLKEIRGMIRSTSRKLNGKIPFEVNNWAWKGKILPPHLRKRHIKKGSYDYMVSLNPDWRSYSHDVTDAMCIYMYIMAYVLKSTEIKCTRDEPPVYGYDYLFVNEDMIPPNAKEFILDRRFSFESNINYYINRKSDVGFAYVEITPDILPLLYAKSNMLKIDKRVVVVVKRT